MTLPNGEPVSILPIGVFYFYASTSRTTIFSTQSTLLNVKDSYGGDQIQGLGEGVSLFAGGIEASGPV